MTGDSDSTGLGFVDVAANALAMMVMATLFVIVLSASPPRPGEIAAPDTPSDLTYPLRIDNAFGPLNRYYFVLGGGISVVNFDPFAEAFAQGETVVTTGIGTMTIVVPRRSNRDYKEYRAFFEPDPAGLRGTAVAVDTPDTVTAAVDRMALAWRENGVASTFFVTPDGFATFAPIYWALRKKGLPLRWIPLAANQKISFSRKPQNFTTRSRRW